MVYPHLFGRLMYVCVFRKVIGNVSIELCYAFVDLAFAQGEHGKIGTNWHVQRGAQ